MFTLGIATFSKADQEYIRAKGNSSTPSTPSTAKLDERIKPGATVKLDFPNLTPDRKDNPAALNMRVPDKYDPAKPVPMIVWLGAGDGGNSAGACAALVDQTQFSHDRPSLPQRSQQSGSGQHGR